MLSKPSIQGEQALSLHEEQVLYLEETSLLDYSHQSIRNLIRRKAWMSLTEYERIGAVYTFVKDAIRFGYNRSDDLRASDVLQDGYGQCNTKGTLLMALLRAVGIECRFHGFTIDNVLQKGAIPNYLFPFAPRYIIHSWVEVFHEGRWLNLEGFIVDEEYLLAIQRKFPSHSGPFTGYAIATTCLSCPHVEWRGESTYIQNEGIHSDYGVFPSPDAFYEQQGTNLNGLKRLLFRWVFRHLMNWNVDCIRTKQRKH